MDQESHTEKIGVGKKVKRLSNKRERGQVKNYLKGYSIEDYENSKKKKSFKGYY